jgi:hypothetical protein
MTWFKTLSKTAAAFSLTLLAASFAHAQGPVPASGSTDIWSADFQKPVASGSAIHQAANRAPIHVGSTDLWGTDFQKVFGTHQGTHGTAGTTALTGSTDIYTGNFEKAFM